jgi:hypothetical protein
LRARGGKSTTLLVEGHQDVKPPAQDWEQLITWMDANALYEDQARRLRNERIRGPELQ